MNIATMKKNDSDMSNTDRKKVSTPPLKEPTVDSPIGTVDEGTGVQNLQTKLNLLIENQKLANLTRAQNNLKELANFRIKNEKLFQEKELEAIRRKEIRKPLTEALINIELLEGKVSRRNEKIRDLRRYISTELLASNQPSIEDNMTRVIEISKDEDFKEMKLLDELSVLQHKQAEVTKECNKLQRIIRFQQTKIKDLRGLLDLHDFEHREKVRKIEGDKEIFHSMMETRENKIEQLLEEKEEVMEELENLKTSFKEKSEELEKLKKKWADFGVLLETMNKEKTEAVAKVEELEKIVDDANEEAHIQADRATMFEERYIKLCEEMDLMVEEGSFINILDIKDQLAKLQAPPKLNAVGGSRKNSSRRSSVNKVEKPQTQPINSDPFTVKISKKPEIVKEDSVKQLTFNKSISKIDENVENETENKDLKSGNLEDNGDDKRDNEDLDRENIENEKSKQELVRTRRFTLRRKQEDLMAENMIKAQHALRMQEKMEREIIELKQDIKIAEQERLKEREDVKTEKAGLNLGQMLLTTEINRMNEKNLQLQRKVLSLQAQLDLTSRSAMNSASSVTDSKGKPEPKSPSMMERLARMNVGGPEKAPEPLNPYAGVASRRARLFSNSGGRRGSTGMSSKESITGSNENTQTTQRPSSQPSAQPAMSQPTPGSLTLSTGTNPIPVPTPASEHRPESQPSTTEKQGARDSSVQVVPMIMTTDNYLGSPTSLAQTPVAFNVSVKEVSRVKEEPVEWEEEEEGDDKPLNSPSMKISIRKSFSGPDGNITQASPRFNFSEDIALSDKSPSPTAETVLPFRVNTPSGLEPNFNSFQEVLVAESSVVDAPHSMISLGSDNHANEELSELSSPRVGAPSMAGKPPKKSTSSSKTQINLEKQGLPLDDSEDFPFREPYVEVEEHFEVGSIFEERDVAEEAEKEMMGKEDLYAHFHNLDEGIQVEVDVLAYARDWERVQNNSKETQISPDTDIFTQTCNLFEEFRSVQDNHAQTRDGDIYLPPEFYLEQMFQEFVRGSKKFLPYEVTHGIETDAYGKSKRDIVAPSKLQKSNVTGVQDIKPDQSVVELQWKIKRVLNYIVGLNDVRNEQISEIYRVPPWEIPNSRTVVRCIDVILQTVHYMLCPKGSMNYTDYAELLSNMKESDEGSITTSTDEEDSKGEEEEEDKTQAERRRRSNFRVLNTSKTLTGTAKSRRRRSRSGADSLNKGISDNTLETNTVQTKDPVSTEGEEKDENQLTQENRGRRTRKPKRRVSPGDSTDSFPLSEAILASKGSKVDRNDPTPTSGKVETNTGLYLNRTVPRRTEKGVDAVLGRHQQEEERDLSLSDRESVGKRTKGPKDPLLAGYESDEEVERVLDKEWGKQYEERSKKAYEGYYYFGKSGKSEEKVEFEDLFHHTTKDGKYLFVDSDPSDDEKTPKNKKPGIPGFLRNTLPAGKSGAEKDFLDYTRLNFDPQSPTNKPFAQSLAFKTSNTQPKPAKRSRKPQTIDKVTVDLHPKVGQSSANERNIDCRSASALTGELSCEGNKPTLDSQTISENPNPSIPFPKKPFSPTLLLSSARTSPVVDPWKTRTPVKVSSVQVRKATGVRWIDDEQEEEIQVTSLPVTPHAPVYSSLEGVVRLPELVDEITQGRKEDDFLMEMGKQQQQIVEGYLTGRETVTPATTPALAFNPKTAGKVTPVRPTGGRPTSGSFHGRAMVSPRGTKEKKKSLSFSNGSSGMAGTVGEFYTTATGLEDVSSFVMAGRQRETGGPREKVTNAIMFM